MSEPIIPLKQVIIVAETSKMDKNTPTARWSGCFPADTVVTRDVLVRAVKETFPARKDLLVDIAGFWDGKSESVLFHGTVTIGYVTINDPGHVHGLTFPSKP
jgi:hypothetical protein